MKNLFRAGLLISLLSGAAFAQHDYDYFFMDEAPVPVGKPVIVTALPQAQAPQAAGAVRWDSAAAQRLYARLEKEASAVSPVGSWLRVGEVAVGGQGVLNMSGFDLEGVRGRLLIAEAAADNVFLKELHVTVQGEESLAVPFTKGTAAWTFQRKTEPLWSYRACRLVDADNMLCLADGKLYTAYTRQK